MEIFNLPSKEYENTLSEYKFIPTHQSQFITFSQNCLGLNYEKENEKEKIITLKSNKTIMNQFNYFYFEAEILNGNYLGLGFGSKYMNPNKTIGLSRKVFNFGILFKEDKILFHFEKQETL